MNKADMLCRFFEHDDNRDDEITWSVSGGSLEGSKRYYRIMYDNSITKLERELVIDVKDTKSLESNIVEFKQIVTGWFNSTSEDFVTTVQKMFMIDPWLSSYTDESIYVLQEPVD